MLIFFSFYVFHAPVTRLNLFGYAFCCTGVAVYNYQKLQVGYKPHVIALVRLVRCTLVCSTRSALLLPSLWSLLAAAAAAAACPAIHYHPSYRSTWAPASRALAAAAQEEGAAEAEGDGHQRQGRYGGRAAAAIQRHWQDGGQQGLRRRHGLLCMLPLLPPLPTPRSCAALCVVCLLPTLLFLPKPALLISPRSLLPLLRSAVAFCCTLVPEL